MTGGGGSSAVLGSSGLVLPVGDGGPRFEDTLLMAGERGGVAPKKDAY